MKFKNKIKIKVNGKKIISQDNETIGKLVKRSATYCRNICVKYLR